MYTFQWCHLLQAFACYKQNEIIIQGPPFLFGVTLPPSLSLYIHVLTQP